MASGLHSNIDEYNYDSHRKVFAKFHVICSQNDMFKKEDIDIFPTSESSSLKKVNFNFPQIYLGQRDVINLGI